MYVTRGFKTMSSVELPSIARVLQIYPLLFSGEKSMGRDSNGRQCLFPMPNLWPGDNVTPLD